MDKQIYAAIDLGSNTILMLIAEVLSDGTFKVLTDEHSIARLGENVDKSGMICDAAIKRASEISHKYRAICDKYQVTKIAAFGTSALRDASNGSDVIKIFSEILNAEVKIIPGDLEANLSFLGSIENDDDCTVIDIGGGSTEFIAGNNSEVNYKRSINVGAVRLKEKFFAAHPPTDEEIKNAVEYLNENFKAIEFDSINKHFYAVAGSPTAIAAIYQNIREFDYSKIHLFELNSEIINSVWQKILNSSIEDIIQNYNMHPQRADIISSGTLILKTALEYFKAEQCTVSVKGLRYGILKNMISNQILL